MATYDNRNNECRVFGYDEVTVNTAELAESLSNEYWSLKTADFGFETKKQDQIIDYLVSQQICLYKVDGNWGQILTMLGMKMAVSSSQSYC